jgi:hypothetical protein
LKDEKKKLVEFFVLFCFVLLFLNSFDVVWRVKLKRMMDWS